MLLKGVVPRKPTLKVLTSIRVGRGGMVASDLQTGVSLRVPELNEDCLMPFNKVLDMLKFIPGDETLTISVDRQTR